MLLLLATVLAADGRLVNRAALDLGSTEPLRIVGSRSLSAPVSGWAAIFRRTHPGIKVTTSLYGTGIAAGALADGLADVAPLHRTLKPDEQHFLDAAGVTPIVVPVRARGHSVIYLYIRRPASGRPNPAALEFARLAASPAARSLNSLGIFRAAP